MISGHVVLNLKKEYDNLKVIYHNEKSSTTIYNALEKSTQRIVIIKSIQYENREIRKNIEMEIRCMINCEKFCAFIPTIYDYIIDEKNKVIIIIMQYIEGELLSNIIEKQKKQLSNPNTVNNNITLINKICNVVSAIHKVPNLVHRDLKPENIIVKNPFSKNQEVYIIDFGISGILMYKTIGSKYYMAPEQREDFNGIYVCQATDIFSLGLIIFEIFTGVIPRIHEDMIYTVKENDWESVPLITEYNKSVPQELNTILKKSLAYNPKDRYSNGRELATAISRVRISRKGI